MAADTGHGIKFEVEGATPGEYVEVGDVQSISLPGVTRGTVDVTRLSDGARRFIGTIPEGGEVSVTILYDETVAAQEELIASIEDADTRRGVGYRITFPSGTTWTFMAVPTGAEFGDADHDSAKTLTFSAKLTGGRGQVQTA